MSEVLIGLVVLSALALVIKVADEFLGWSIDDLFAFAAACGCVLIMAYWIGVLVRWALSS